MAAEGAERTTDFDDSGKVDEINCLMIEVKVKTKLNNALFRWYENKEKIN